MGLTSLADVGSFLHAAVRLSWHLTFVAAVAFASLFASALSFVIHALCIVTFTFTCFQKFLTPKTKPEGTTQEPLGRVS